MDSATAVVVHLDPPKSSGLRNSPLRFRNLVDWIIVCDNLQYSASLYQIFSDFGGISLLQYARVRREFVKRLKYPDGLLHVLAEFGGVINKMQKCIFPAKFATVRHKNVIFAFYCLLRQSLSESATVRRTPLQSGGLRHSPTDSVTVRRTPPQSA